MGSRSADKIKFRSFDDLFGEQEPKVAEKETAEDQVVRMPLAELHSFKRHPFRVMEDEEMMEMVESVRQFGVLVPVIVRPDKDGGYEIIAGHRRKRASELAGCSDIPVIVRDLTDDESVIAMVDSNIQRLNILPSEKARAYRMKMEAMEHQGVKGGQHTAAVLGGGLWGECQDGSQVYPAYLSGAGIARTGGSETDSCCFGGEPFFFEGRGAGTGEGLCGAEAGVSVKGGSGIAAGGKR